MRKINRIHRSLIARVRYAVCLLPVLCTPHVVNAQQSASSQVAVVDLKLVFDNLQPTISTQQRIDALRSQLDELAKRHQNKTDQSSTRLLTGDPLKMLEDAEIQFEQKEQNLKLQIVRIQARQLKAGWDDMKTGVAEIARQKGIDLVLNRSSSDLPPGIADDLNLQTEANLIFNRSLLYANDQIDITPAVIDQINGKYRSGHPTDASFLPITKMKVGSKVYDLEIANDEASREHGLMERDTLPPNHGMIFVFPEPQLLSFWMHHTRFPLDVIFADANGLVTAVSTMNAYVETTTSSISAAKYAIELPAGELKICGVHAGDKLQIPAVPPAKD